MFHFNIKEVLLRKGIKKPESWLRSEIGLSASVAKRMVSGKIEHVRFRSLFKLCEKLHLTPDALIVYEPSPKDQLDAHHPVQEMKRKVRIKITDHLQAITPSQLARLEAFALELRKEERDDKPPEA